MKMVSNRKVMAPKSVVLLEFDLCFMDHTMLKSYHTHSGFRSHTELLNYFCEVPLRGSVARCTYFAVNIISNQTCVS